MMPPSIISNKVDLFDGETLKKELRVNIDYKAVSSKVWYFFLQTYGGGPIIARESIDIYSKPVSGIHTTFEK